MIPVLYVFFLPFFTPLFFSQPATCLSVKLVSFSLSACQRLHPAQFSSLIKFFFFFLLFVGRVSALSARLIQDPIHFSVCQHPLLDIIHLALSLPACLCVAFESKNYVMLEKSANHASYLVSTVLYSMLYKNGFFSPQRPVDACVCTGHPGKRWLFCCVLKNEGFPLNNKARRFL